MSIEIYYFSGTGNSLHVAREVQKRVPQSTMIPIVGALKSNIIKTNSDVVGFVFPNFCLSLPIPVYDFLQKADISSADYIFTICTRGGSVNEAFSHMNHMLRKQDRKINAALTINMPWNLPLGREDLPGLVSEENRQRLEMEMRKKLDRFSPFIIAREDYREEDREISYAISPWIKMMNRVMPRLFHRAHFYMYKKRITFYSNVNCISCGICEQVCLSEKIKMVKRRPVWEETVDCLGCFACINYCPQKAIQIKSEFLMPSYTEKNGRYHHSLISYGDIANQKK